MLRALIIVCAVGTPVTECHPDNMRSVNAMIWAPGKYVALHQCFFEGMAYAAGTTVIRKNEYPKVFCIPMNRLDKYMG